MYSYVMLRLQVSDPKVLHTSDLSYLNILKEQAVISFIKVRYYIMPFPTNYGWLVTFGWLLGDGTVQ